MLPTLTTYLQHKRLQMIKEYIRGDILDLGCGLATLLDVHSAHIDNYYGVDCDTGLIRQLRAKYPKEHFLIRDLDRDSLNFKNKFDVILMVALIEHIYNQKHILEEAINCLALNGKIVITTPTPFGNDIVHFLGSKYGLFSKDAADDHIVIYNRNRFQIMSNDMGLRISKYQTFEFRCNQLVVLQKK